MTKWSMVIDLEKCVACQGCSIACRFENNTPAVPADQAARGREMRWNDVFPMPAEDVGEYPNTKTHYITRPCMHCENPPCIKVCPVQATHIDDEGIVRQNYARCIGCRFCTVACPYGVRYFNWYPSRTLDPILPLRHNPDRLEGDGDLEGPAIRPKGVVEKCTYCIHRLQKARARAKAEGRELRSGEYIPACVETCTGKARYFGDLDDPDSIVSKLAKSERAFRLLEEVGTHPKTIYLQEGE